MIEHVVINQMHVVHNVQNTFLYHEISSYQGHKNKLLLAQQLHPPNPSHSHI